MARGGFTSIANPLFLKGLENVKGTYETASTTFPERMKTFPMIIQCRLGAKISRNNQTCGAQ